MKYNSRGAHTAAIEQQGVSRMEELRDTKKGYF